MVGFKLSYGHYLDRQIRIFSKGNATQVSNNTEESEGYNPSEPDQHNIVYNDGTYILQEDGQLLGRLPKSVLNDPLFDGMQPSEVDLSKL